MSHYAELFRTIYRDAAVPPVAEDSIAAQPGDTFRVLLVDDELSVLKALRRVLSDEICEVLIASDAGQALQLLETEAVQLIISDQRMPGMGGAELLREVKQRHPDIIRIMLTGLADIDAVMQVVEEIGVFKFITKPWNDDDLRLTTRLAFKQYQLQQENSRLRELNRLQQGQLKTVSDRLPDNSLTQSNLLQNSGAISKEQLLQAQTAQLAEESFIDCLLRLKIVNEEKLQQIFQQQLKLPGADLKKNPPSAGMLRFLPLEFCQRGQLLPLELEGRNLTLAMVDPSDLLLRENIELLIGLQLRLCVTTRSAIEACLQPLVAPESQTKPDKGLPKPVIHPQIPQLQAGLAALRQGLECVEDVLSGLSADSSTCPLCGKSLASIPTSGSAAGED